MDPCLLVKKYELGTVYVALYVDDNLVIGNPAAIDDTIERLKREGLILKVEDDLHDYLSCEIVFSKNRRSAWLGQPHLFTNLISKFGPRVIGMRTYKTPGTPGFTVVRPTEESEKISEEDQALYRSGVGMLLYLVKLTRPDLCNATRELSKAMDGANPAAFKELHRVIKYAIDTKDLGLKFQPTFEKGLPWELLLFTDSDYATDPDSRRSVSGFLLYVCGVPVCWRSKAQRSVTLSSSEAEYVSLSEGVKEVMFVVQVLESMKIKIAYPIVVRVDNIGAIFMSKNVTTTTRTKHVDVRYKYVNEYVEDGIVKVIFVKSEENEADVFTKNLGTELHNKHCTKLIGPKYF